MKTRNLLAVLASAFMLTACNNESPDTYPNWYPDSYIIGFEGVENLDASALHLKFFNLENKTMDIAVAGKQELPTTLSIIGNITDNATTKVDFLAKEGTEQATAYKEKTAALNDVSFKGFDSMFSRDYVFTFNGRSPVLDESVVEISVTCDKTIGAVQAGKKLNDILMIFYEDQLAVVSSGYRNYAGADAYKVSGTTKFPYALRGCKLSEFNSAEHPFISNTFLIYAENLPLASEDYTFTITVKTKEGTSLQKDATLEAL